MNAAECQEKLEELADRYETLMDKLQAERECADSAQTDAEHALHYLEGFKGNSGDVAIALTSLRGCVDNLQSRYKKETNRKGSDLQTDA